MRILTRNSVIMPNVHPNCILILRSKFVLHCQVRPIARLHQTLVVWFPCWTWKWLMVWLGTWRWIWISRCLGRCKAQPKGELPFTLFFTSSFPPLFFWEWGTPLSLHFNHSKVDWNAARVSLHAIEVSHAKTKTLDNSKKHFSIKWQHLPLSGCHGQMLSSSCLSAPKSCRVLAKSKRRSLETMHYKKHK